MAQKVVQMTKNWNCTDLSKIGAKLILSVLTMTMDKVFKNILTRVVQMAQKVVQMTKNWNCIEVSQNWYWTYFKLADYEYEHRIGNYFHPKCCTWQTKRHTRWNKWPKVNLREMISKLVPDLFEAFWLRIQMKISKILPLRVFQMAYKMAQKVEQWQKIENA